MVAIEDLLARPTIWDHAATYAAILREHEFLDSETILPTKSPEALSVACNIPIGFAMALWDEATGCIRPSEAEPAAKRIKKCWPSGSWRALVEEEVARKLPVPSHVYDNVMQSYPRDCKDLMVEAAGFLPCYIVTCLDMLDKAEDMAVCGGSHTFMTRFISQISRNAGPGYKLDLKWHRDAAMTCAWSVVGASHPGWRLDIQDRHVAAGNDRAVGLRHTAIKDVLLNARGCNPDHYLPVDGTVACAAAEDEFQFIFFDLQGNESFRCRIFSIRYFWERVELFMYVAAIYRGLAVAQKYFRAEPIRGDREDLWLNRPNGSQIMRCNDKHGRSNGLPKAKFCTDYAGLVVVVEMEMYCPDLERSAPEDKQSFKAACRGLLGALALLHDNNLVHCGIKAANIVLFDKVRRDAVVLVDLDSACQVDTIIPKKSRLPRWDDATLDKHGCYGKASDVHEAGKLLRRLLQRPAADQFRSNAAAQLCDELIGKRLTACDALRHLYLAS